MKRYYVLFSLLFTISVFAQRIGTPLLRYYPPSEYKGFAQNWCIAQDDRGVMYFGNGKGILEYNGRNWRRFPTERRTTVLSMTKGADGRIYIGGENEIGYLAPDSTGLMQFVSLDGFISDKEKNFTYVWAVHATGEGICFVAGEKILCWDGKIMRYFYPKDGFFTSFCVNNRLYVMSNGEGLLELKEGRLHLLRNTAPLNEASVRLVAPLGDKLFIATRKGLFTYKEGILTDLRSGLASALREKGLYKGTRLPDGNYALGTVGGGVFIVDSAGKSVEVIDDSKGLQGKSVYFTFVDRENELWLAQESGISRISYSLPIRILDERHGLHGIVRTLSKSEGSLLAATFQGVYKLDSGGTFSIYSNLNTPVNTILPFQHKSILLSTGEIGTVEVRDGKQQQINTDPYVISMRVASEDSSIVLAGSVDKAYVFKKENGRWSTLATFDSLGDEINSIAQVGNTWWLSTTNSGVLYAIQFSKDYLQHKLRRYDTLSGLAPGLLEVYAANNTLFAGTSKGAMLFNSSSGKFTRDDRRWPAAKLDPPSYAYVLHIDHQDNHWALINKGFGYFRNGVLFNEPFLRIGFTDYYAIHTEANGTAWLGGTNGIALYTPTTYKTYKTPFHALVTRAVHDRDTLFNGAYYDENEAVTLEQNQRFKAILPYISNTALFEYACAFFDEERSMSYSYMLDGFDEGWSDWVKETRKEYTNLPEGAYTFRVKARNLYGAESTVANYSFTILAPWYRSWWAYLAYACGGGLLVWLIIKLQTARLRRENEKLERLVKERTAEVTRQKDEIAGQNEKLQQAYSQIEEKQKEILDSIHYAKRIQSSLLPTEKYLVRALEALKRKRA